MESEVYSIQLNLDRNRIKTVLSEAYDECGTILETDFIVSKKDFLEKADLFLSTNRVSTPITLQLPSKKYPELRLEVDPRKKSIIARMHNIYKRVLLNRYLTKL